MRDDELAEVDLSEAEIDAMIDEGEPVEVERPFDPVRRVKFELIGSRHRTYRWRLVAANGEVLANSANTYRSHDDAYRAVSALSSAVKDASIVDADDGHPDGERKAS